MTKIILTHFFKSQIGTILSWLTGLTISEHAWRGKLDVGKSSEVIQHSTTITILLCIIHKGPDVVLLTMVTDTGAYHHGDVIWLNRQMEQGNICK